MIHVTPGQGAREARPAEWVKRTEWTWGTCYWLGNTKHATEQQRSHYLWPPQYQTTWATRRKHWGSYFDATRNIIFVEPFNSVFSVSLCAYTLPPKSCYYQLIFQANSMLVPQCPVTPLKRACVSTSEWAKRLVVFELVMHFYIFLVSSFPWKFLV